MKKTMTKEEFGKLWVMNKGWLDFYDALSEAGISFDIYTDSDGQIIKPGDMCEFWDSGEKTVKTFYGYVKDAPFPYLARDTHYANCRKLPTEVWEPVPLEDVQYFIEQRQWPEGKWEKTRSTNGKLEGVRKMRLEEKLPAELKSPMKLSEKLLLALKEVIIDVNWMINEQRFLNPHCFDRHRRTISEAEKELEGVRR